MGNAKNGEKALYQIVIDDLLARIEASDYVFNQPLCTERSIMEKYAVSRITAKRAITELESRGILYRKRGLGSFVARNLDPLRKSGGGQARIYAFILPFDTSKGGLLRTVQVLNDQLNSQGHFATVAITDRDMSKERAVLRRLSLQDISGLAYYPTSDRIHLDILDAFVMRDIPVVIVDKLTDCPYIHNVVSDNFTGAQMLAEHLIGLGHTRIAYLSRYSTSEISTIRDRFGGYLHALKAAGIVPDPSLVVTRYQHEFAHAGASLPSLRQCLCDLRARGATAIECENDEVALNAILTLREMGVSVPGQVSVTGFDNTDIARMIEPGITTAAQDFARIGEQVVSIFQKNGPARREVVPVQLVVQDSTGPVPGR